MCELWNSKWNKSMIRESRGAVPIYYISKRRETLLHTARDFRKKSLRFSLDPPNRKFLHNPETTNQGQIIYPAFFFQIPQNQYTHSPFEFSILLVCVCHIENSISLFLFCCRSFSFSREKTKAYDVGAIGHARRRGERTCAAGPLHSGVD